MSPLGTYICWAARLSCVVTGISSAGVAVGQRAFRPPPQITAAQAIEQMGGPTLVTVTLQDVTPDEVFRAVAEQTGMAFDTHRVHDHFEKLGKISVDYRNQPAWDVLVELARQMDVSLRPQTHPNFGLSPLGITLDVVPSRDANLAGPRSQSGHFTVIVRAVTRQAEFQTSGELASPQRLVLDLTVLVDPKIRPRGEPRGSSLKLSDDQERALKVETNRADQWTSEISAQSPAMWHLTTTAELSADAKQISRIEGKLRFVATTKSETWKIDNVLSARTHGLNRPAGAALFVFKSVAPLADDKSQYVVTVWSYGKGETPGVGWPPRSGFDRLAAVRLFDAQGQRLWAVKADFIRDGQLAINYRPAVSPSASPPATLHWELPTEVAEIIVPFEFQNLPLP